jgi:D-glycero-alpha-D-manno-heptose-7-phosphate kinase
VIRTASGRVPVRLDLAGGTLDIWPVYLTLPLPAVTVNVAVDLPARARVSPAPGGKIRLTNRNRGDVVGFPSVEALRSALTRDDFAAVRLLARAVEAVVPEGGLDLETEATSPAGAGLGGSSALLACVVATLAEAAGRPLDLESVRRLAQDLETWVIAGPTGYQDYYPALHGGCLALEGRPGGIDVERLPVDLDALGRRLRLVYTGAPRMSGVTNWGAMKAWFDREPATRTALVEIARLAVDVRAALRAGDLDRALAAVVEEGRVRRRLAPGIATAEIDAVDRAAVAAGALGTKILGAGGGGCVLVVLPAGGAGPGLDAALAVGGARPLPCAPTAQGLRIETGGGA